MFNFIFLIPFQNKELFGKDDLGFIDQPSNPSSNTATPDMKNQINKFVDLENQILNIQNQDIIQNENIIVLDNQSDICNEVA